MYKISDDIYNAIKNKIIVKEISEEIHDLILETIIKSYVDTNIKGGGLWERLSSYEAYADSNGWTYIQDFVLNVSCILFFNQDDEKKMFSISNGKDLHYILSETCGFEFYITDKECSYLLCFTHHDVLIGCGKAKKWVSSIREAHRYSD